MSTQPPAETPAKVKGATAATTGNSPTPLPPAKTPALDAMGVPPPPNPSPTPPPAGKPKGAAAPPPPAKKAFVYFRKELFSSFFYVAGHPAPFEPLDGNRGVAKLDPETQGPLIAALNAAASKRIGGIVKISEEEYTEKKSLHPYSPSSPSGTRSQEEKLRIAPRAGMAGKAFRPPPPKSSVPKIAAPAGDGLLAPPTGPIQDASGAEIVDGVPQGPNPVPDFVPRVGRVGDVIKDPPSE